MPQSETGRELATRTWTGIFCPECKAMAIASEFGYREIGKGRNLRRYPFGVDHHWCDTDGCKHRHKTGDPWGSGLPYE